jgi:hypothetical protein
VNRGFVLCRRSYTLIILTAGLLIITGCFQTWGPSDDEAVSLLTDYYSFYEEKGVEAEVVKRGEYIKECACYPIEFEISDARHGSYRKTFYFYKNTDGSTGIKKFKYGVKYSS